MPRMRARTAAGSSVASWNSTVERVSARRMPSFWSRSPMAQALIGTAGRLRTQNSTPRLTKDIEAPRRRLARWILSSDMPMPTAAGVSAVAPCFRSHRHAILILKSGSRPRRLEGSRFGAQSAEEGGGQNFSHCAIDGPRECTPSTSPHPRLLRRPARRRCLHPLRHGSLRAGWPHPLGRAFLTANPDPGIWQSLPVGCPSTGGVRAPYGQR